MPVTAPLWAFAAVLLVGMLGAYTFGWMAGRSSGKVEAYEQELGIADDDVDDRRGPQA